MRSPDGTAHWSTPKPRGSADFLPPRRAGQVADRCSGGAASAGRAASSSIASGITISAEGSSATINDFGLQGESPTHPELLEWLANDLVEHDWSLKHLHRSIVLSQVIDYRGRLIPPE